MLSVIEIGEKIAIARKMKNYSQAQLAECLMISAQAVGKWERGESMPDIIMFQRLAEVLEVDLNYFSDESKMQIQDLISVQETEETEEHLIKSGWDMSGGNWIDADFSGLQGLAEKFNGSNIKKCQFIDSDLTKLTLKRNNIIHCDFTNSNLSNSKFVSSTFDQDKFSNCDFSNSEFIKSNVQNSDFTNANLTNTIFKWGHLRKVNMSGAVLTGTVFKLGQLTEVVFDTEITNCSFENYDFARVTFQGTVIRNSFFKNCKLHRAKFIDCKVDKITYAFLKSCKADLSAVEII